MNKKNVRAFLELAFNAKQPHEAFAEYVSPDYRQHNPHAPDGRDPSARFLAGFVTNHPGLFLDIKRVIAEDDLVVTHSLMTLEPGDRGTAIADIVRCVDGKIVEHWDVAQPLPESAANANTMF